MRHSMKNHLTADDTAAAAEDGIRSGETHVRAPIPADRQQTCPVMTRLLKLRPLHLSLTRHVNSQTQLSEPTLATHPRAEKYDAFCENIKSLSLPIDWEQVKNKLTSQSAKGLKHAFEIRTINCVLVSDPPVNEDIANSLYQYINPRPEMVGQNPILDIHLAALSGRVNAQKHADMIKTVVLDVSKKFPAFSKYKAFVEALKGLSSTGKQNCELVANMCRGPGGTKRLAQHTALQCLKHGMLDLAMETDPRSVDYELDMQPWIDAFHKFEFRPETLRNFLTMMSQMTGAVAPSSSDSLQELLSKSGYKVQVTELDGDSKCTTCGSEMPNITNEEYETCRKIVRDRVFERGDTFFNSNPLEMRNFLSLINSALASGHYYDLVIDALNVSHVTTPTILKLDPKPKHEGRLVKVIKSKEIQFQNLKNVIQNSLKLYDRVLLIGRKHMYHWPKVDDMLAANRSQMDSFFLNNSSEDDPFIIYAAMQSPSTYVMSNDHYRDHKFLIDDHLFERWLRSRVIRPARDGRTYHVPPKHETRINFSPNWTRIHVPIGYNNTSFTTWICCQKSNK